MTPCLETNNYSSNPTWCFSSLYYAPCQYRLLGYQVSICQTIQCICQTNHLKFQNHLHRHLRSLEKASFHTILNCHTFWPDEKTLFWRLPISFHIQWETLPVYLFFLSGSWLFLLALQPNSIALEPVPLWQICSQKHIIEVSFQVFNDSDVDVFTHITIINTCK